MVNLMVSVEILSAVADSCIEVIVCLVLPCKSLCMEFRCSTNSVS